MGERTINGKSVKQILEELKEPFPGDAFKEHPYTKRSYIPVYLVKRRLDDVLGLNYDFTTGDLQLWKNGSQQNIALIGAITIRDDEGKIVSVRGMGGGSTIIYPNKDDSAGSKSAESSSASQKEAENVSEPTGPETTKKAAPANVSNDIASASMDVLKRSAKLFGVGDDQLREMRNLKPGPLNVSRGARANSSQNELQEFQVVLKSGFSTIGSDGYIATVELNSQKIKMVVWKDGQNAICSLKKDYSMAAFISECKIGKTLTFLGTKGNYKGEDRLVLMGFKGRGSNA